MDALTRIKAILTEAEKAAYRRGWEDAFTRILATAKAPTPPELILTSERETSARGRGQIIQIVRDLVRASPGLRGTAIVDAVMQGNPGRDRKAIDRTTRTALRRLSKRPSGGIENRDGRWYPKGDA